MVKVAWRSFTSDIVICILVLFFIGNSFLFTTKARKNRVFILITQKKNAIMYKLNKTIDKKSQIYLLNSKGNTLFATLF